LDAELEELKVAELVWQRLSARTQRAGQTPNGHDRETEPPPAATTPWTRTRDGSLPLARTAGIGASRPLRRIPTTIVSFLNPQQALSLVGGNGSSCPKGDLRLAPGRKSEGLRLGPGGDPGSWA
jgi:hypothetical protein